MGQIELVRWGVALGVSAADQPQLLVTGAEPVVGEQAVTAEGEGAFSALKYARKLVDMPWQIMGLALRSDGSMATTPPSGTPQVPRQPRMRSPEAGSCLSSEHGFVTSSMMG